MTGSPNRSPLLARARWWPATLVPNLEGQEDCSPLFLVTFRRLAADGDSLCGGRRTVHSLILPPAPHPTRLAPDSADRLDLTFNVDEDGPVTVSLQPLVNERPQHHLKAHRALEFAHRLSGEAPRPVEDPLGNHEEDLGLVLEHRYLHVPA